MILKTIAREIKKGRYTRYKISQDTGIDESVLHRIVNNGSCSIQTADVLLEYLGLSIVKHRKKAR